MAGRRWAQGKPADESSATARPRPSERGKTPSGGAQPSKSAKSKGGAPQKPAPNVSDDSLARAQQRLSPPQAPWHPLPLAEAAIVIGFLAILLAALLADRDGVVAGFVLIMLGTAEFSWREHRNGFRPHATVLAGIVGVFVGATVWRFSGLGRNACIGIGLVVFLFAWSAFDRSYVPMAKRQRDAAEDAEAPARDAKSIGG